jgi:hypothetical protein
MINIQDIILQLVYVATMMRLDNNQQLAWAVVEEIELENVHENEARKPRPGRRPGCAYGARLVLGEELPLSPK